MRFVYSLVRFVPDPARGEFVNVGAIAGSEESSDWAVRQVGNPARARSLGPHEALGAVWSLIGRVGSVIDEHQASFETLFDAEVELSEAWLDELHRDHRNIVQLSPPAPLVADSAEQALDKVFDLMIVDPGHRRYPFRKKNEVLAALRRAYREQSILKGHALSEQVILSTSRHRQRLDFAVANGQVVQLAHSWSFQVPDQETLSEHIKSWGWTVRDARETGGSVMAGERSFEVGSEVAVEVAYIPPAEGQSSPAMDEAMSVFAALEIDPVPVERADQVATRAHHLLHAAA